MCESVSMILSVIYSDIKSLLENDKSDPSQQRKLCKGPVLEDWSHS